MRKVKEEASFTGCRQRRLAEPQVNGKTNHCDRPGFKTSTMSCWRQLTTRAEDCGTKRTTKQLAQRFSMHLYLACGCRPKGLSWFVHAVKKRTQVVVKRLIDVITEHSMSRTRKRRVIVETTQSFRQYLLQIMALLRYSIDFGSNSIMGRLHCDMSRPKRGHLKVAVPGKTGWYSAYGAHLPIVPSVHWEYSTHVVSIWTQHQHSLALRQNTRRIDPELGRSPPKNSSERRFHRKAAYLTDLFRSWCVVVQGAHRGARRYRRRIDSLGIQIRMQTHLNDNTCQAAPHSSEHRPENSLSSIQPIFSKRPNRISLPWQNNTSRQSCTRPLPKLYGIQRCHPQLTTNRLLLHDGMRNKHRQNQSAINHEWCKALLLEAMENAERKREKYTAAPLTHQGP